MSRYAVICFDHHAAGEDAKSPCFDLAVDIRVPWSWIEATIGEVVDVSRAGSLEPRAAVTLGRRSTTRVGLVFETTIAKIGTLAERYQPACPACKEPLHYVAWSVEDYEDD